MGFQVAWPENLGETAHEDENTKSYCSRRNRFGVPGARQ
jgi:hypothetical protein